MQRSTAARAQDEGCSAADRREGHLAAIIHAILNAPSPHLYAGGDGEDKGQKVKVRVLHMI